VLQHLVGVDDVEGVFGQIQRVHVTDGELGLDTGSSGRGPRLRERFGGDVQPEHPARSDAGGEVGGDGARTAADVEQVEPRAQRRQEVGGGVLGGAPAVRLQHRLGMAVGVGVHACSLTRTSTQWNHDLIS
jgi:hypothetical protein